jgi:hypothetical protein
MFPHIRDNLKKWMSEEIASKAYLLQEDLKGNFESKSINISYKLKSITGRFNFPKINY